jgi:hypothetical protein
MSTSLIVPLKGSDRPAPRIPRNVLAARATGDPAPPVASALEIELNLRSKELEALRLATEIVCSPAVGFVVAKDTPFMLEIRWLILPISSEQLSVQDSSQERTASGTISGLYTRKNVKSDALGRVQAPSPRDVSPSKSTASLPPTVRDRQFVRVKLREFPERSFHAVGVAPPTSPDSSHHPYNPSNTGNCPPPGDRTPEPPPNSLRGRKIPLIYFTIS